jgi:hypothetical protein
MHEETVMKQSTFLQKIIGVGAALFVLTACSTYASTPIAMTPTSAQVSQPSGGTAGQTASANAANPVSGSVVLEEGRCCISGIAGDTVQVLAKFSATSQFGKVTRMRVSDAAACASAAKMEVADWEPFVATKTFPVVVSTNWVGFYVSAQFMDEHENLSPVYCDDISVEGTARAPAVNPTDWYAQIQCFADNEVHPGPGETVTGTPIVFGWPDKNNLPEGVFYKVSAYSAIDHYTALVASGLTKETTLTLQIPTEDAGDMVWYVTLVDANGTLLDHGRCSSFAASLLTANPPGGIKGIHFLYKP